MQVKYNKENETIVDSYLGDTSENVSLLSNDISVETTKPNVKEELSRHNKAKKVFWGLAIRDILLIALICLGDFLAELFYGILTPFYPQESIKRGLSYTEIGIVIGAFPLIAAIVSIPISKVTQFMGGRLSYVSGMFLCAISIIAFGFVEYVEDPTVFFWLSIEARVLGALGMSLFINAGFGVVSARFPEHRGILTGILEFCAGVGGMAGPVIGGVFYDLGGFKLPFLISGAVLLLTTPANIILYPEDEESQDTDKEIQPLSLKKLATIPDVYVTGFCCTAALALYGFSSTNLSPLLSTLGLGASEIGLVFLIYSATYGIGAFAAGMVVDKTGRRGWWV